MKGVIIFLTGLLAGSGIGYYVSKKKADKKLKSIEETYKEIGKKRAEKKEAAAEEVQNETDSAKTEEAGIGGVPTATEEKTDDEASSEEEEDDDEGSYVKYTPPNTPDHTGMTWDEFYEEYYDDEETRIAREEFEKEIADYIGTGQSYNINYAMYALDNGYEKRTLIIDDHGEYDRAYDAESGEEIKDYIARTMAFENDTLNPKKSDENGRLFVRCEPFMIDYEVKWAYEDLIPPWVDDIEDDGTD